MNTTRKITIPTETRRTIDEGTMKFGGVAETDFTGDDGVSCKKY